MRAGRLGACAVLLVACACTGSGAPPSPATSASRGSRGLDTAICNRDQRFLSEVDTEYANDTNDFNSRVNGVSLAQARPAAVAYEAALQKWIGELQSTETSTPYDPVRLLFLQGMRDILHGLRIEYRRGSETGTSRGNAMVDQGAGRLSIAYRELFDVSKRFCPGSFLASQSPG